MEYTLEIPPNWVAIPKRNVRNKKEQKKSPTNQTTDSGIRTGTPWAIPKKKCSQQKKKSEQPKQRILEYAQKKMPDLLGTKYQQKKKIATNDFWKIATNDFWPEYWEIATNDFWKIATNDFWKIATNDFWLEYWKIATNDFWKIATNDLWKIATNDFWQEYWKKVTKFQNQRNLQPHTTDKLPASKFNTYLKKQAYTSTATSLCQLSTFYLNRLWSNTKLTSTKPFTSTSNLISSLFNCKLFYFN